MSAVVALRSECYGSTSQLMSVVMALSSEFCDGTSNSVLQPHWFQPQACGHILSVSTSGWWTYPVGFQPLASGDIPSVSNLWLVDISCRFATSGWWTYPLGFQPMAGGHILSVSNLWLVDISCRFPTSG